MARVFLSYSPRDEGRGYLVEELIASLVEEIVRIAGWPEDDIVHCGLELGEDKDAMVAALQECDVFVPLLSPCYRLDVDCGKQWWLFEQRVRMHAERHGRRPSVVVPIMWEMPTEQFPIPEIARSIDFLERDLVEVYGDTGLRRLVANDNARFGAALEVLAKRIVQFAEGKALAVAEEKWEFATAKNIFDSPSDVPADDAGATRSTRGWKKVQFVVTAATADQVAELRRSDGRYDSEALEWRPYGPETLPLAQDASFVALEERLTPSSCDADRELQELIDQMEHEEQLVVLLVDPWTLRLPSYHDRVRTYDSRQWLHTGAVVVWDEKDSDTTAERNKLDHAVGSAFRVTRRKDRLTYSNAASTREQFAGELKKVIDKIHGLLVNDPDTDVREAAAIEPSAPEASKQPPRLDGPQGVG